MRHVIYKYTLLVLIIGLSIGPLTNSAALADEVDDTRAYLGQISSMVAGRPLTESEITIINSKGRQAIPEILNSWLQTPFFIKSANMMLETQLGVSGEANDINFELPGNLMSYIVRNQLPYSEILTANYCVDNSGQKTGCDTGAPYTAGVLTTKAFMYKNSGRFNLGRAGKMLHQFACREYPMEANIQIPLQREELIPMFQVLKGDDNAAFGNGAACYACHSQFGAHAQFFVKFDAFGNYRPSATGEQDPEAEPGASIDNLYTSHMIDPTAAKSESSQMFGRQVSNLRGAAVALTENRLFLECGIRNTLKHFLRLVDSDSEKIGLSLIQEIASNIKATNPDPSFQQIVVEALKHPKVMQSTLKAGEL